MKKKFYNFVKNELSASLYIYGDIGTWEEYGEIGASTFKAELDQYEGLPLTIYINSFGGDVSEGLAISSLLKRRTGQTKCVIDGFACSIASIIACSCKHVAMYPSSMMMVHNALLFYVSGNADELRESAKFLDQVSASLKEVYLEKASDKLTHEKISELMDNEAWLSAEECIEYGLADEVIKGESKISELSNKAMLDRYKNVPKNFNIQKCTRNDDSQMDNELMNIELELLEG